MGRAVAIERRDEQDTPDDFQEGEDMVQDEAFVQVGSIAISILGNGQGGYLSPFGRLIAG